MLETKKGKHYQMQARSCWCLQNKLNIDHFEQQTMITVHVQFMYVIEKYKIYLNEL